MTAPTIASVTFDETSYAPGETITATVAGQAGTSTEPHDIEATFTLTDTVTGQAASASGDFTLNVTSQDPTDGTAIDPDGRTWAVQVSQTPDGIVTAVFTATA